MDLSRDKRCILALHALQVIANPTFRNQLVSFWLSSGANFDFIFLTYSGICLACSLHCHEKHELVELYTKRNFHCDCGIKEGSVPCKLDSLKASQAGRNNYNQNFVGLYCNCRKPYPDPENKTDDEMIQCVICEDWLHSLHLNADVPGSNAYDEMICGECMKKNYFLADYKCLAITVVEALDNNDSAALVDSLNDSAPDGELSHESKKPKLSEDACVRPKRTSDGRDIATFWKGNWRQSLCKCSACLKLYTDLKVEFLIDPEDTTHFYEEKGKGNEGTSSYMASLEALGTLPRVNQIDAISGYNRMKDKLFEFLQVTEISTYLITDFTVRFKFQTFVVNNQIVQEEDIQRFFRNIKNETQNEQPIQQPHFCR